MNESTLASATTMGHRASDCRRLTNIALLSGMTSTMGARVSATEFMTDLRRKADRRHIRVRKEDQIASALSPDIAHGAELIDVFGGTLPRDLLVITSLSTWELGVGTFGVKVRWHVDHDDLRDVRAVRGTFSGHVFAAIELETEHAIRMFKLGLHAPDYATEVEHEIAESNAVAAAEAILEQFRNRQPSPADAWLVNGLVASLGVTRELLPQLDVSAQVREATHRLRTISSAVENAGGSSVLYRNALDEIARLAPDVDVSDVLWS
jgi:hypothetical protein